MLNEAERSLLLICARQNLSPDLAGRAGEILRRPLSWERLAETAWRHGVASLLFRNGQALPGAAGAARQGLHLLRQCYVRAAFRNETHYTAIAELAERAANAGLDIVLLKGAALARTLYLDPALRPFADIDLLVPNERVEDAKQMLIAAGYEIAPDLLSEKFNRRYHSNLPLFRRAPHPIHVELHWRLSDPFSLTAFDHAALFARSHCVPVAGNITVRVLSPEDELVYLAAHLDNHGYLNRMIVERSASTEISLHELSGNRLIWFTDLHELIGADPDWPRVMDFARNAGASDSLAVSLRLLRALLGTPIPGHVLSGLPLPGLRWPERKVGDYVFSLAEKKPADAAGVALFQQRFLATRTGFELRLIRLLDIWQYIFPQRTALKKSYPVHACAAVLHCGAMLLELLGRHALRLVRVKSVP